MLAFVFLIFLLILTYMVRSVIKPKKYPPGPGWYPFFGCNGIISNRMSKHGSQWKVLSEMAKEYSTKVLGLKLGSELVVVVYGEKNIRVVTTEKEFDARPDSFFLRLRNFGKRTGITFVDGPLWREHRTFTLKSLKSNGFGRPQIEDDNIHEQLNVLLNILERSQGNSISVKTSIAMSVLNVLWKYVAGEHIEEDKIKQLLHSISLRSKVFTMAGGYLNQWPWLRFILPNWTGYSIIMKLNTQIADIIQDSIIRHKNKTVAGNDLIHSFLEEMYENKQLYTEDQLTGICLDIIIAGSNTINSALNFAIVMLLRHPDVQQKVYKEIQNVLGDKLPTWADSTRLPYTSAFISEVHRCCTVAPFAGGRRALTDYELDGYVIPKGTTVLVSLGDLHIDPDVWLQPDKFMPERFIDENGKLKTVTNVYPFSMGRRRCLGESFAKSFIFIVLVGILQKYKIVCNGPPPSAEPMIGLLAEPKHFTAQFLKRL
ncbi:probable cytochrome P450 305a1 [Maniola jurtina]|uniref:probable cytochrome P450 305a1 n=1 Tax=Maniola jurtina TaxID=191418 RepID=UPI001E687CA9|nr:probable cytochrome P450 305a1 [Maniola jurtina]